MPCNPGELLGNTPQNRTYHILVVDDNAGHRALLKRILQNAHYSVAAVPDGRTAQKTLMTGTFDLVVTDLRMEGSDGIEVLKAAKKTPSCSEVIIVTGFGSIESAVVALKLGAFDYLTKPLDETKVEVTVRNALLKRKLEDEVHGLREKMKGLFGVENIITSSQQMKKVIDLIKVISDSDCSVLITGESGTGKELVAKAIHYEGLRSTKPFLAVNCAAFPESLLESELFGHVQGAFTGAIREKKGLFEEAQKGTLFLDEVSEMSITVQAKLLRTIQEGEVRMLGSNTTITVDVRIIASTNMNLQEMIYEQRFREDLYYRLNVIPIKLPALRERKEDIPLLVRHFVGQHTEKYKTGRVEFSEEALEFLTTQQWPGNVRQLRNIIERIIAIIPHSPIYRKDVQRIMELDTDCVTPLNETSSLNLHTTLERIEKEKVLQALTFCGGNHEAAARALGISRTMLWRKIQHYGLS
jgi:DNA-binding NtrC family response regulator